MIRSELRRGVKTKCTITPLGKEWKQTFLTPASVSAWSKVPLATHGRGNSLGRFVLWLVNPFFQLLSLQFHLDEVTSVKPSPDDFLRTVNEDGVSADEDVSSLANLVEETDESSVDLEKVTFILYDRPVVTSTKALLSQQTRLPMTRTSRFDPSWVY
ncbi:unnamed protein product [Timema podura]|uniref:Uncharacterized protein n=1 Tax=Timema podura TaxID=61482 RepID=A0ABN7P7R9_TIMPD|nr:unnamed protein product [Timema podura]